MGNEKVGAVTGPVGVGPVGAGEVGVGLRARVSVVALFWMLSGCASTPKDEIFDQDGPTTEQIYLDESSASPLTRDVYGFSDGGDNGLAHVSAYTRTADRELMSLFPELRNQRLNLYVFPHITASGAPVPGYSTAFYLYLESQLFALPGEAIRQGSLR